MLQKFIWNGKTDRQLFIGTALLTHGSAISVMNNAEVVAVVNLGDGEWIAAEKAVRNGVPQAA